MIRLLSLNTERILFWLTFFVMPVAIFLLYWFTVEPFVNDDTAVYFTYAKQFLEGRFFAYDARNIPSEGFTSILFLFLVIPLELFNIPPFLGVSIYSILAVIAIPVVFVHFMWKHAGLSLNYSFLLLCLCYLCLVIDPNISTIITRAMETMFSPLCVILAFLYCCKALLNDTGNIKNTSYLWGFCISGLLAFFIRPENIITIFVFALVLLLFFRHRKQLFVPAVTGLLILASYFLWKWFYFGDIFPTGYYRKFAQATFLGKREMVSCIVQYWPIFTATFISGFLCFLFAENKKEKKLISLFIIFSLLVLYTNYVFGQNIYPLVNFGCRFIINVPIFLYLLLPFFFVFLISKSFKHFTFFSLYMRQFLCLAYCVVPIFVLFFLYGYKTADMSTGQSLHLSDRVRGAWDVHRYVLFSKLLATEFSKEDMASVVYADAGLVPYYFDGIFIDWNGLTEPEIAKMFRLENNKIKVDAFANYILQYKPDLLFLTLGYPKEVNNIHEINMWSSVHGPFGKVTILDFVQRFHEEGYHYLCSVFFYNPVHFAVNPNSRNFSRMKKIVWEYVRSYGGECYPNGIILKNQHERLYFTPLP